MVLALLSGWLMVLANGGDAPGGCWQALTTSHPSHNEMSSKSMRQQAATPNAATTYKCSNAPSLSVTNYANTAQRLATLANADATNLGDVGRP
jgi:hypothetical protein